MLHKHKQDQILRTVILLLLPLLGLVLIHLGAGAENNRQKNISKSTATIPSDPPDASLISFGPLNGLGEAEVTGLPGAALPEAHILLVNLDTSHQAYTMTQSDGSFQTKIFAPPGSNIMIKHGPSHTFHTPNYNLNPWNDVENGAFEIGRTVFPSTVIYRPHNHTGPQDSQPFAAVGAIGVDIDSRPTSIDAAWSMTGTVSPVNNIIPGSQMTVTATIRLYSQAIISTTDISTISLQMDETMPLLMIFTDDGNPLPYNALAGSTRLTPGGFPILDATRPQLRSQLNWLPVDWQLKDDNSIVGDVKMTLSLDKNMPPGVYRPILRPVFDGVPAGDGWIAALISLFAGVTSFDIDPTSSALPPLKVLSPHADHDATSTSNLQQRLIWYLMMDNAILGTRGTGAFEDREIFQPSSLVVNQGAQYIVPPRNEADGEPILYRLEPYLPMISYGRGTTPGPPLLPFKLPGGELCVTINRPDGQRQELGCAGFVQSISGDRTTELGELLNFGTIEIGEYYGLTTADERFMLSFTQPGYHAIEMTGWIEDVWGNRYEGGGTYEVWVAQPIDIDYGILPGTPIAVGDAFNPTIQLNPRFPAHIHLTLEHYPGSDPAHKQTYNISGWANRFGYYSQNEPVIVLDEPGEYRVNIFAEYIDPDTNEIYAGSATWGGVIMTPFNDAQLVAHGRRGSDNHTAIPNSWFVFCDEKADPPLSKDSTPHLFNPYLNGDILWSYDIFLNDMPECNGDALILNSSVQDPIGTIEPNIIERALRRGYKVGPPGDFEERVEKDALPLFSSTSSGRPPSMFPEEVDQIAYAYLSSQRPGIRVRESVAEDTHASGYWRLDTAYDYQPGVGIQGDLPNDFKYQFVGAVYRDLESGENQYLGQATGWVHLPYSDTIGSRVMPPFSGPGNGGWTTQGGPIMTLKGQDIHMFILPTGVRPGAILQTGDRFEFGGHIMPTLDSQVQVTITSPSGTPYVVDGQANSVGYFYDPSDSFVVDEPGLWVVEVKVWHDGRIGSGEQVNCDPADPFDPALPCPSGNILGSAEGFYPFYVVPPESERLKVTSPISGRLTFGEEVTPIEISGPIPPGVTNASVDYTINMPGFILDEGQAQIDNDRFRILFDPKTLNKDFPNLDLHSRHGLVAGLADTFSIGLLLTGLEGEDVLYQATTITIQGDQVTIEDAIGVDPFQYHLHLPAVLKDS